MQKEKIRVRGQGESHKRQGTSDLPCNDAPCCGGTQLHWKLTHAESNEVVSTSTRVGTGGNALGQPAAIIQCIPIL